MKFKVLGREVSIEKTVDNPVDNPVDKSQKTTGPMTIPPVDEMIASDMIGMLTNYATWKQALDQKIIDNEEWYKLNHWKLVNQGKQEDTSLPEPVTAFLVNAIMNKHADAMDNFPEAVFLEREPTDVDEAERLSKIVPTVLEKQGFRKTYSRTWYYKLKQGAGVYGIFWNPDLEDGNGDIDIKKLDILRMYWQPMIDDIQDSKRLYIVGLVHNDILHQQYPHLNLPASGTPTTGIQIKDYFRDYSIDLNGMSMVVDCYEKFNVNGKNIVHLTKLVDIQVCESSRNNQETNLTGIYDHGKYPVVADVMLPEEGTPIGFGLIDIAKNPQAYIDKLDSIIEKNSLVAGKQRFFYKKGGGVRVSDLLDLSKDAVEVEGSLSEEHIRPFQAAPLHPFIREHRQDKILELKDTVGNRDFQTGGTAGGVTAYGAIMALQEAGNKLSRDMISESYVAFSEIVTMCVELIRQFYDDERTFRITGAEGNTEYVPYTNAGLQPQMIPPKPWEGKKEIPDPADPEGMNTLLVEDPEFAPKYRKPVFDLKIKAQKSNPFNTVAQNQMAMDMYKIGMFNPETAPATLVALEMMTFEGKEKLIQMVKQNGDLFMQMQQMQEMYEQQIMGMRGTMDNMATAIEKATGRRLDPGDSVGGADPTASGASKPAGAQRPPPAARSTGGRPGERRPVGA